MAQRIELKEIERKVYTSYHQDGLMDISIAFIVLAFGIMMVLDMAWMGAIFAAVGIPLYAAAKKVLTVPRIGFVKFAPYRAKAMQTIALVVFSLLMLLGVVAFMQVEGGSTPTWLLFAIEYPMLVIGSSLAILFCLVGYTFRTKRMYAYALLSLTTFFAGSLMYFPLYYYMILLGTLLLLFGSAMLIRFVRKYPLRATGTTGDSDNEKR
jgi:hypothetical protein